ncbi:MAG: hypothetical protein ACI379_10995 [Nocardioides sp.]|uniref:hypothetical protein n=1 Tax=Nocardioides sp. TaxID=35761 RepID=UPI003F041CDB
MTENTPRQGGAAEVPQPSQPSPQAEQPPATPPESQPGQPYEGQPHAGQPYAGQPYPAQAYAAAKPPLRQRIAARRFTWKSLTAAAVAALLLGGVGGAALHWALDGRDDRPGFSERGPGDFGRGPGGDRSGMPQRGGQGPGDWGPGQELPAPPDSTESTPPQQTPTPDQGDAQEDSGTS